ncbi:hypothetical protein ZIOFF_006073 [Zingiber officinale]|uniref:Uncharacterized protein n=1 Tax=Zingiber officinale TaxID=94328 RepID=A0A8J5IDN8_ZINOF|nr:hypothetical protein ZIOFF_006073 [Zingiber officinale]
MGKCLWLIVTITSAILQSYFISFTRKGADLVVLMAMATLPAHRLNFRFISDKDSPRIDEMSDKMNRDSGPLNNEKSTA